MKSLKIIIIFIIFILAAVPEIHAAGARITDLVVTKDSNFLLISASLNMDWKKPLKEALESGIETVFVYRIKLFRKRDWLPDELIADEIALKAAKYDNLSGEYKLQEKMGPNYQISSVKGRDQAQWRMSRLAEVKLIPLKDLNPRADYYLEIKAHMDNFNPPVLLKYLLFLIPLREFETPVFVSSPFKTGAGN